MRISCSFVSGRMISGTTRIQPRPTVRRTPAPCRKRPARLTYSMWRMMPFSFSATAMSALSQRAGQWMDGLVLPAVVHHLHDELVGSVERQARAPSRVILRAPGCPTAAGRQGFENSRSSRMRACCSRMASLASSYRLVNVLCHVFLSGHPVRCALLCRWLGLLALVSVSYAQIPEGVCCVARPIVQRAHAHLPFLVDLLAVLLQSV
jgi:hypothetical protein